MLRFALLLLSGFAHLAVAELYVNSPLGTETCAAGQPCLVSWLDDGGAPLLPAIGPCTVGLYHGNQNLVQAIEAVDVVNAHALTFTPQADAGPDSNTYYIAFTSLSLRDGTGPYQAFSPSFTLTGMRGSFASPVPSLTRSLPVPVSVASGAPASVVRTSTLGTITGIPTIVPSSSASVAASSRFNTSSAPASSFSTSSSLPTSSSSTSSASDSTPTKVSSGALQRSVPLSGLVPLAGTLVAILVL